MTATSFVIGHRGAAGLAPENTLASMEAALDNGVRWVEFDVKLSADGVPYLMHDDTLDRTTDGKGPTNVVSWDRLAKLDAGTFFSAQFAAEPVPTLRQCLSTLAHRGVGVNVEIKAFPGDEAQTTKAGLAILRDVWPNDGPPPIISSFNMHCLEVARDECPEYERACLYHSLPDDWENDCKRIKTNVIHLDDDVVTDDIIAAMIHAGYALRIYTVNDRARAEHLKALGVAAIFTDRPDVLSGL